MVLRVWLKRNAPQMQQGFHICSFTDCIRTKIPRHSSPKWQQYFRGRNDLYFCIGLEGWEIYCAILTFILKVIFNLLELKGEAKRPSLSLWDIFKVLLNLQHRLSWPRNHWKHNSSPSCLLHVKHTRIISTLSRHVFAVITSHGTIVHHKVRLCPSTRLCAWVFRS